MTTREEFLAWFNDFHIEEIPHYQTIRDFSFAAYQAATDAALERAAVVCDELSIAEECATAIRALKENHDSAL